MNEGYSPLHNETRAPRINAKDLIAAWLEQHGEENAVRIRGDWELFRRSRYPNAFADVTIHASTDEMLALGERRVSIIYTPLAGVDVRTADAVWHFHNAIQTAPVQLGRFEIAVLCISSKARAGANQFSRPWVEEAQYSFHTYSARPPELAELFTDELREARKDEPQLSLRDLL